MSDEVSWSSTTLKIGQFMSVDQGGDTFTIRHMDRSLNPFLTAAIINGVICHTGLFPTLGQAKAYLRPLINQVTPEGNPK